MFQSDLYGTKVWGYGCVVISGVGKERNDYNKYKVYRKLSSLPFLGDAIRIEEVFSRDLRRPVLDDIVAKITNYSIDQSSEDDLYARGCIIVTSIADLGPKPEQVYCNYIKLLKSNIGLFVLNSAEYSTVFPFDDENNFNGDFLRYSKPYYERCELLATIDAKDTKKDRLGYKNVSVTSAFKASYWLYEGYVMHEDEAIESSSVSKVTFHKLCKEYESSPEYIEEERIMDSTLEKLTPTKSPLRKMPKRDGKVSEKILALIVKTAEGISLQKACEELGLPEMSDITCARYVLKAEHKRSLMTTFTNRNYRYDWMLLHKELKAEFERRNKIPSFE